MVGTPSSIREEICLFQLPPELRGSAGSHTVSEVEDWSNLCQLHVLGVVKRDQSMDVSFVRQFKFNALTLLDTVLFGTLEVLTLFLLAGDALNALVVVVLVRGASGGVGALCR